MSKSLDMLFVEEPENWWLRGHPLLWNEFRIRLSAEKWPDSKENLREMFEEKFRELTGYPLSHDESIYMKKYDQGGGMSGGAIGVPYWLNEYLPLILERFDLINAGKELPQQDIDFENIER